MRFRTEIIVHGFGNVPDSVLMTLIPVLKDRFRLDASIGTRLPIPPNAYDRVRDQYLSTDFLELMQERFRSDSNIHLGVADVDLYVPDLAFVFGEASPATWTAVFSIARLLPGADEEEAATSELLRQRASVEAVHELGHVLGLAHCPNPRCVMWFSNQVEDTDRKGNQFCKAHRKEIDSLLSEWNAQAPPHFHY